MVRHASVAGASGGLIKLARCCGTAGGSALKGRQVSRRKREWDDRKMPPLWRAVIYLREPYPGERSSHGSVPSVDQQRVLCRREARGARVEVAGEFLERSVSLTSWRGLAEAVWRAREDERLLFLVVSWWDRLAGDYQRRLNIGWRLGAVGTTVLSVEGQRTFCVDLRVVVQLREMLPAARRSAAEGYRALAAGWRRRPVAVTAHRNRRDVVWRIRRGKVGIDNVAEIVAYSGGRNIKQ